MAELLDDQGGMRDDHIVEQPAGGATRQHDLDFDDGLMVHGADDHPFAPAEDNGELVPASVERGNPAPQVASMTPEEHAAAIKEVLDVDSVEGLDLRTLVFDFGPFSRLELQLRELCAELVSPEIADAVISHVRQSIHDVVVTNPQLVQEERTQDGLLSRINALKEIGERLQDRHHPGGVLMAKLKGLGAEGVHQLDEGISNMVKLEHARLTLMTKDLAPASIGSMIFSGFRRLMPGHSEHLVGDARRNRNSELVKALGGLKEVATEIKANAGNVEWERTQGAESTREVAFLRDRVHKLTKGVEDQVDSRDLRKGLDDVNELLASAESSSADDEHKSRLKELVKSMAEFMKQLTDALGRLFGKSSDSHNAPRPA